MTFKDLDVWKTSMTLVEQCYRLTNTFPRSETYGLSSQLRRAAVSIPSNIAEGHCRRTTGAYANHVSIALGSYGELDTCIELASRLDFLSPMDRDALARRVGEVGRLLYGLHNALERRQQEQS